LLFAYELNFLIARNARRFLLENVRCSKQLRFAAMSTAISLCSNEHRLNVI